MSAPPGDVRQLTRRYLESAVRLGDGPIVLERTGREEALRLAALVGRGASFAAAISSSARRSPAPDSPTHSRAATPGSAPSRSPPPDSRPPARRAAPAPPSREPPPPERPDPGARRPVAAEPEHDLGEPSLPSDEILSLSREATAERIGTVPDLATLRAVVERCTRCPLHVGRKNAVFGEGDPAARVVCVGEAPGAVEDETGRPFVGRAGQLLDRLLATIGLARSSVYICNVLKSRPPNNRDPLPEEVAACSPYLARQLELIDPEVVVAFGAFAARTLLETKSSLGNLRGRLHRYGGYPVIVTYHPAALLRNPGWTRPAWEDLQIVRRILDGDGPAETAGVRSRARDPGSRDPAPREDASEQGGLFG